MRGRGNGEGVRPISQRGRSPRARARPVHGAVYRFKGRRYNRAKKQGARTDLTSRQSGDKSRTSEALAEEHGVNCASAVGIAGKGRA